MRWLAALLAAWLLGSLPWGLWLGKLRGVDVRRHGSGNLGATNVYRILGPKLGITVLLLDAAKGVAAVLVARLIVGTAPEVTGVGIASLIPGLVSAAPGVTPESSGVVTAPADWPGLLGFFAAVLGHSFTPFARFHGGKGVATAAGAWGVLAPVPLLLALAVWTVVFAAVRIVSAASMAAAVALPIAAGVLRPAPLRDPVFWFAVLTALLLVVRHRGNLVRLRAGEERPLDLRGPGGAEPGARR